MQTQSEWRWIIKALRMCSRETKRDLEDPARQAHNASNLMEELGLKARAAPNS